MELYLIDKAYSHHKFKIGFFNYFGSEHALNSHVTVTAAYIAVDIHYFKNILKMQNIVQKNI